VRDGPTLACRSTAASTIRRRVSACRSALAFILYGRFSMHTNVLRNLTRRTGAAHYSLHTIVQ
jgi:hypothetical protein